MKSSFFAALALTVLPVVAGCAANVEPVDGSDTGTVDVTSESHTVAPRTLSRVVRFDADADIALHRAKVRGAALGKAMQTMIEGSGQTVVYDVTNPQAALSLKPVRAGDGSSAAHLSAAVASSDPSVATASVDRMGNILVAPTGKLGNAYVTSFDSAGQPTNKFMFLALRPRENTMIVRDGDVDGMVSGLRTASMQVQSMKLVTDFAGHSDIAAADMPATASALATNGATLVVRGEALAKKVNAFVAGATNDSPRAVYLADHDTLLVHRGGARTVLYTGGEAWLGVDALGTQADFASFVDYGGVLHSSPLSDGSRQSGSATVTSRSLAKAPVELGRFDAKGHLVKAGSENHGGLVAAHATRLVRYAALDKDGKETKDGGLVCRVKGDAELTLKAMFSQASVGFSGTADYKDGKPSFALDLTPQAAAGGGQVELTGAIDVSCNYELFKVPVAEWTLPLVGQTDVSIPVSVGFRIKASKKGSFQIPLGRIGSKADLSKAGKVGFSYTPTGGFSADHDITIDLPSPNVEPVEDGQDGEEGSGSLVITDGVSAGLSAEAKVTMWGVKATVEADIGSVLVGAKVTVDETLYPSKHYADQNSRMDLGVFPEIAPTLSIDTFFFHASLNLFSLDLPDLVFASLDLGTSKRNMIPALQQAVVTCDGDRDTMGDTYSVDVSQGSLTVLGKNRWGFHHAELTIGNGSAQQTSMSVPGFPMTGTVMGSGLAKIPSGTKADMDIFAGDCPYDEELGLSVCRCHGTFE